MTKKKTTARKTTKKAGAKRTRTAKQRTATSAKRARAKKSTATPDKAKAPKRVSLLDAAATVLAGAKKPMQVKAIVEQVVERGLWKPRAGKTPAATLHAAMSREIAAKEKDARFRKVDRGQFTANRKGA